MKETLCAVWKLQFEKGIALASYSHRKASFSHCKATIPARNIGEREYGIERSAAKKLEKKGMVKRTNAGYRLTEKGRRKIKVVACGGVFDILHPGHAFFLQKAKEQGDVLAVIVARDSTVEKRKRIPIVPERQRVEMVRNLKQVDVALLGRKGDFFKVVEKIKPDIIALGPNQIHSPAHIKNELKKRGMAVKVVRVKEYKKFPLHSTRSILQKIIERNYPDKRLES